MVKRLFDLKGYLSMETSLSNIEEFNNLITITTIKNLRHACRSIKRHFFTGNSGYRIFDAEKFEACIIKELPQ